MASQTASGQRP